MPKIRYVDRSFSDGSLAIIRKANEIIADYTAQGFDLTLRQIYYQFVSRALIANKDSEYKRLGGIINDARLAGLIDWDAIEDRTRNLQSRSHWTTPGDIIKSCAYQYSMDLWRDQPDRVEVWIEKDALVGVLESVCPKWDVPFFSCRGYTSQSEMWSASQRLIEYVKHGQSVTIIHLGDHDPSGIDMTRDITDRLELFASHESASVSVHRIALTRSQVDEHNPPPNPAKITDSRAKGYIAEHGNESWELDALEPKILVKLIEDEIMEHLDATRFTDAKKQEEEGRALLKECATQWAGVRTFLSQE